jgi:hypothetical protein
VTHAITSSATKLLDSDPILCLVVMALAIRTILGLAALVLRRIAFLMQKCCVAFIDKLLFKIFQQF